MIPLRYIGFVHCLGLTYREEGVRGLMRGYFAYILATTIYLAIVPLFAELIMLKSSLYGNYNDTGKLENTVLERQKEKAQRKLKERVEKKD
jgi:hypothetical protein